MGHLKLCNNGYVGLVAGCRNRRRRRGGHGRRRRGRRWVQFGRAEGVTSVGRDTLPGKINLQRGIKENLIHGVSLGAMRGAQFAR